MIKTSYFANHRKFPKGVKTVSISRIPPKWATFDTQELRLAPSKQLLYDYKYNNLSWADYRKRYWKETLSKLDPVDFSRKYEGCILLCFEKPEDHCHRDIVRDWLKWSGIESEEL